MRPAFEASGEIRSVDLLAAFVTLWRERASGRLFFERDEARAGFEIAAGEIASVTSSEPQFETSAILVRAGKLDPGAFARVVAPEGADSAAIALQGGLVTRKDWRWGQKIRAIEVVADLLGWIEGRYEFDAAGRPDRGEFPLPIPRLILELFLRSRDRALIEHALGPSDVPLVRSGNFDGEFEGFGLTADAGTVVALIDGKAAAAEISERAPADEFAVLKLLAALTTLGLIHPADAAPHAAQIQPPEAAAAAPAREEEPEEEPRPEQEPEPEQGPRVDAETEAEAEAEPEAATPEEEAAAIEEEPEEEIEAEVEPPPPPRPPPPPDLLSADLLGAAGSESAGGEPPPSAGTEPRRRRAAALLIGLPILLAAALAGLLLFRSRRGADSQPAAPPATPTREALVFPRAETAVALPARRATAAPTASRPTASPTAPPTPVATSARPTPRPTPRPTVRSTPPPTPRPTAVPTARATLVSSRRPTISAPTARPAAIAPTVAAPAPAATPVPGSREQWLRRAERDRARFAAGAGPRYAVQLELACELTTLADVWKYDKPAGTMWLLPAPYRGRTCFRVLWGHYATREKALREKASVPGLFVTPENHPVVVLVR